MLFFCKKNADISKIKGGLVPKVIFSETTYKCVLTCQIASFYHISNEFYLPPPSTSKQTPKKLTQITVSWRKPNLNAQQNYLALTLSL